MTLVRDFTQPDAAPDFAIEFLDSMDRLEDIRNSRADTLEHMALLPGSKVLDVGCGVGGVTFSIAELSGPSGLVAGVDMKPAFIDVAIRRASARPGMEFRVGNASSIPYANDFFDAAYSERVFLYLPSRRDAIQEMQRVVKPGGRVWLLDADVDSMAVYSTNYASTRKMLDAIATRVPNPNSARELPHLLRQAGLRDRTTEVFAISASHEILTRAFTATLAKAVADGELTRTEVDDWLGEQSALQSRGDFFCTWMMARCSGTV